MHSPHAHGESIGNSEVVFATPRGKISAEIKSDWFERSRLSLSDFPASLRGLEDLQMSGVNYKNFERRALFERGEFSDLVEALDLRLKDLEIGGAVVDFGSPIAGDEGLINQSRLLTMIIGERYGEFISINEGEMSGTPFFPITVSLDPRDKNYVGNGKKNTPIGPHTDGSGVSDRRLDLMALVCVQRAEAGGESVVVNALKAYHALPGELQTYLLQRNYIRQNPYNETDPNPIRRPVFEFVEHDIYTGIGIKYHRQRLNNGHAYMKEALSDVDRIALDTLDQYLCDPRFKRQFLLQSGQILFLNNHLVCHDRTAFTDSELHKRRLERFWAGALLQ